jgi:hypothetical protein
MAKWSVFVVALLAGNAPTFASVSDRAVIHSVVMGYFSDRTGRGGGIFKYVWIDSRLGNASNPYGSVTHDDFKLNDIRIWISGNRAIVSAHTSEVRYDPESSAGLRGPRDICVRQLDLRKRRGEWRMYDILHEQCRFAKR